VSLEARRRVKLFACPTSDSVPTTVHTLLRISSKFYSKRPRIEYNGRPLTRARRGGVHSKTTRIRRRRFNSAQTFACTTQRRINTTPVDATFETQKSLYCPQHIQWYARRRAYRGVYSFRHLRRQKRTIIIIIPAEFGMKTGAASSICPLVILWPAFYIYRRILFGGKDRTAWNRRPSPRAHLPLPLPHGVVRRRLWRERGWRAKIFVTRSRIYDNNNKTVVLTRATFFDEIGWSVRVRPSRARVRDYARYIYPETIVCRGPYAKMPERYYVYRADSEPHVPCATWRSFPPTEDFA